MASHVRYILNMSGGYFGGPDAFDMLSRYTGSPIKTRSEAIYAAKKMGVRLWVFREPRGIKKSRSRYKQMCSRLGIYRKLKTTVAYNNVVAAAQAQMPEVHNVGPIAGQAPQQPW